MTSSKPGIATFTKLKITIDAKKINVNNLLISMKFSKQDQINFARIYELMTRLLTFTVCIVSYNVSHTQNSIGINMYIYIYIYTNVHNIRRPNY